MLLIKRYIFLLFISICSICSFSQTGERAEVICIPYADTISQDLIDYIYSLTKPYILSYHPQMAHLIPEMRCKLDRIPAPCETFEVNGVKFNMMCVEGGTFIMGKDKDAHQVTLSDYMIAQTELTQALWKAVMGKLPKQDIYGDDIPVVRVTFDDCQMFCDSLSKLTGLYFRLPTEAEWEYAARGGKYSKGFIYAGSDSLNLVAWNSTNSTNLPNKVALLLPNELGIYDMNGNVWTWVSDWYAPYDIYPQINPVGPISGNKHLIRGACVCRKNEFMYLTYRHPIENKQDYHIGLRLVLDSHQYVDLGLSVKWATCNVGASTPEEFGDYFSWGETQPKESYSWENYKWCNGSKNIITKYTSSDGLKTLEIEDDAAHVNWGGEWRIPTKAELTELREQCIWEWTEVNGVKGCKVIGPNGNSIFLPAAGSYNTFDNQLNSVGTTGWLFSVDVSSNVQSAQELGFSITGPYQTSCSRCLGLTIRPVLSK